MAMTTNAAEPEPSKPMMISEAKLPAGFPAPGPVGEVIVKTYPAHRLARTAADPGGDDRMFMRLFGHIKRNEIAMTAPVTMDWAGEPAERGGPESMAFLYGKPSIGAAGAALTVAVAQAAQAGGWQVQALSTEEGRLEDVFRSITLPDTVAR
jgi:hypothetical protein